MLSDLQLKHIIAAKTQNMTAFNA